MCPAIIPEMPFYVLRWICRNMYYGDMRIFRWSTVAGDGSAFSPAFVQRSAEGGWSLHSHDFHEVFWVDSGKGAQLRPDGIDPLRGGMLVFVRPSDMHGFRAEASTEPFSFINVAFPSSAWLELARRYQLGGHPPFDQRPGPPPILELAGAVRRDVSTLFREILHQPRTELVRDTFLLSLAVRLAVFRDEPGMGRAPTWLRTAILGSGSSPDVLRGGVANLARRAGCSVAHLSRTMKASIGVTPSEWILTRRLTLAAQLLEATSLSVSEVAAEAGFENLSHFHRCFLRSHKVTPLRFRKERARAML